MSNFGKQSQLRLKEAAPGWADALSLLALEAKASWGYPEDWVALWRNALRVTETYIQENRVRVLQADDQAVAFFAVTNEGVLEHLWVLPSYQKRGLGRQLLDQAKSLSPTPLLLLESDPFAEAFYLHEGAQRFGTMFRPWFGSTRELPILSLECNGGSQHSGENRPRCPS
jgi:GNAT superfamily N-acetyltransferase